MRASVHLPIEVRRARDYYQAAKGSLKGAYHGAQRELGRRGPCTPEAVRGLLKDPQTPEHWRRRLAVRLDVFEKTRGEFERKA